MNLKQILRAGLLLAGCLVTIPVVAAEFFVENVSGEITCGTDSPLLDAIRSQLGLVGPICGGYGPATLLLTITTAPDEFKLQCDGGFCSPGYDTYIVAVNKGLLYVKGDYRPSMWQLLPADVSNVPPTFPWHIPFSSLTLSGKIDYKLSYQLVLDDTFGGNYPSTMPLADLELYVGISPIGQKVFTPSTFKKIWPQP